MFTQFPKKTLFSKFISGIVAVSFILTSVPVKGYASDVVSHSLRERAGTDTEEFIKKLQKGNDPQVRMAAVGIAPVITPVTQQLFIQPQILALGNNATLPEGARTGRRPYETDAKAGADGWIINHSEQRKELEGNMRNMLDSIVGLAAQKYIRLEIKTKTQAFLRVEELKDEVAYREEIDRQIRDRWDQSLQVEGLSAEEIKATLFRLDEFLKDIHKYIIKKSVQTPEEIKKGDLRIETYARILVNKIINSQLKKIIELTAKYPNISKGLTCICVGETIEQEKAKIAEQVIREDLEQILEGITLEQLKLIRAVNGYEPRSYIAKGETPPYDVIEARHKFIKEVVEGIKLIGAKLKVLYGASLSGKNALPIFRLTGVDGGIPGGASEDPATLAPIVEAAIIAGEEKGGEPLIILGNHKASTKVKPIKEFVDKFKALDLSKVQVAIATNDVGAVKKGMFNLNQYLVRTSTAFWLSELYYPAEVDAKHTEVIGDGYTKETLTYEAKAGEFINSKLKALFKDDAKEGDVYVFLKKNGKVFALGKENKKEHTLATVSTADLSDTMVKTEYYSMLLEFVSKITEKTGEFIELVEQDGERLKRFLSRGSKDDKDLSLEPVVEEEFSLGDRIKGIKYWFGDQQNLSKKFFQTEFRSKNASLESRPTLITFKPSPRLNGGGLSLIVQPKENVLVNGAGTVGYRDADAMRKSGFFVKGITVGNLNPKARDAFWRKGYTLYYYKTDKSESFDKEKIKVVGTLNEILESKTVDIVIDGSEDGKGNKKIYDKQIEKGNMRGVIFQGGEDADIAPVSYSSSTNHAQALGAQYVRVVSCNTTGLARTFGQITETFENVDTTAVLDRRMKDPKPGKGDLDTVIAEKGASHHAADVLTVLPDEWKKHIKTFRTLAVKVPTTHFHMHVIPITATGLTAEKVTELLKKQSRVGMIDFKKEIDELALYEIYQEYLKINDSFLVAAIVSPLTDEDTQGNVKIIENGAVLHLLVDQQSIVVPETPNAAQAMLGISKDASAAIRIVDEAMGIDEIKKGLEKIAPVKLAKKPSAPKAEVKLPIDVFTESDVTIPATVAVRDDLNSSKDAERNIILGDKLFNGAKVISKNAEKGNKVVVLSHQGRKKDGQPDKDYTEELDQHALIMSKLTGKKINYVPDLFGIKALDAISNMKSGEILQLKNARSWETETDESMSSEEHSKTPLIQNLSKVLDYILFPNLAILHRYNVTIDGWPIDMPIILGDKVTKDIANIENARQILMKGQPCLFIAGGAKIDDYLVLVDKGLESNMFAKVQTGGLFGELCLLVQGYQLGKPTMKILEKQFKKFESENEYGTGLDAMVKEVEHLLEKHPGKIDVPIDVAFINKAGERQVVVVEEKHKNEAITDEYEIRDIGDATADKYAQDIKNAKGVLIKGPLGDVTNEKTAVGSRTSYGAVVEKQEKDAKFTSVLGGGDAGTTFDRLKLRKDKFSVVVDAGGALIVYLAEGPEGLPGLVAAQRSKKYILEKAKALNVDAKALLNHSIVDKSSYNTVGGFQYGNFVDAIKQVQESAKPIGRVSRPLNEKEKQVINTANEILRIENEKNKSVKSSIDDPTKFLVIYKLVLDHDILKITHNFLLAESTDLYHSQQDKAPILLALFYDNYINQAQVVMDKLGLLHPDSRMITTMIEGAIPAIKERAWEQLSEIEKETQQEVSGEKRAIIVDSDADPNYFKSPGATNTLLKTLELGDKIGIFGKNAKNFSALLGGGDDIIIADTDKELIADLKKRGITRIKILAPSENPAFTTAATLTALYNTSEVYNAFEEFYKGVVKAGVIEQETYDNTVKEVRGKINAAALSEQIGAIELPEIKLTTTAQTAIDAAKEKVADFIAKISV